VKKRFKVSLDDFPEVEHRVVQHLGERRHISRDINLEFEKKLTLGQRLADRVVALVGAWTIDPQTAIIPQLVARLKGSGSSAIEALRIPLLFR
jgi:uncharacterized membrane protein